MSYSLKWGTFFTLASFWAFFAQVQAVPWAAHSPNSVTGSCLLNAGSPRRRRRIPQSKQAAGGWQHPMNIKKLSSSSPYKALQEVTAPVGAGHGAAEIQTLINLSGEWGERSDTARLRSARRGSNPVCWFSCLSVLGCANAAWDQHRNLQTWITSNFWF